MKNDDSRYRILIEASKLTQNQMDGVARYLHGLINGLWELTKASEEVEIDLLLGNYIISLKDYKSKNPIKYRPEVIFKKGILMNIIYPFISRFFQNDANFNRYALWNKIRFILFQLYQRRYYPVQLTLLTRLGKGRYNDVIKNINQYDLVHVALPQNILFLRYCTAKCLVTLHDISHRLFPDFHTKDNIFRSEKGINLAIEKEADFKIVSYASQKDFLQYYPIKSQSKVIYEAVDISHLTWDAPNYNLSKKYFKEHEKKYFICIGTLEPRKNLMNVLKSFSLLEKEFDDIHLVVIGGKGWNNKSIKKELGVQSDNVHFLGYIADEFLGYFYHHAIALVYPSFYEGFGLPLLESMTIGTPVIYGNNSAMVEIVGENGIAVNPNDSLGIKEAMKFMMDPETRNKYKQLGLQRATDFSWRKAAVETLDYYKKIIDTSRR